MIHLNAMRKLVHHDHLHALETEPVPAIRGFQHQLNDFPGVEVAAHKLRVRFVLFERHDREVISFHDGVAYCGDALEKVLSEGGVRTGEGLDEDNAGIGLLTASVEAFDADGHGGKCEWKGGEVLRIADTEPFQSLGSVHYF